MHMLAAVLFFVAHPFWQTRAPEQWTDTEIETLRTDSPWAQQIGPGPQMLVYLATAAPIEAAEAEVRLRGKIALPEPDPDYSYYLLRHRATQFILAVAYPPQPKDIAGDEEGRMERESVMIVGGKTYKMAGYFPPVASDPVLRLVFPREVQPSDKTVRFQLYLPNLDFPERDVEFRVKELKYRGKLEM